MSDNLVFNNFLLGPLEGETWASRIVLRIFCSFSSVYLAAAGSEKPIIGG